MVRNSNSIINKVIFFYKSTYVRFHNSTKFLYCNFYGSKSDVTKQLSKGLTRPGSFSAGISKCTGAYTTRDLL